MGSAPIISKQIRVRYPEHFAVGEHSIVDDFCYFSTRVRVGMGSHIANNCSTGGGPDYEFRMGDFSSLSAGSRIWCATNDYANDLVAIAPPGLDEYQQMITGDVTLENFTGVGSNTILLPGVHVPEGAVIGALSLVLPRTKLEPWSVYAGCPIRKIGKRDRERVTRAARAYYAHYKKR